MTDEIKTRIKQLREQGFSYSKMADEVGIKVNTIKSYLSRLMKNGEATYCKSCGRRLKQTKGHRQKKFCNNRCRQCWWKHHQDELKRKVFNNVTCAWCGNSFAAYGNRKRKYCCRACYLATRGQKEEG